MAAPTTFTARPCCAVVTMSTGAAATAATNPTPWLRLFAISSPIVCGRSNATINFAMFLVAFAAQAFVGVVIGWFPQTAAGYDPQSYIWAFGLLLALELLALIWYLFVPLASLKEPAP